LEYFIKTQKLNQRQAKYALYLSRFDFTLKHVPEVRMGKVDRLSRRLYLKMGVENNNENQKLIKRARGKDKVMVRLVEEMKKAGVKALRDDEWKIELLYILSPLIPNIYLYSGVVIITSLRQAYFP